MFDKVLIANRGEIACRIIRSCRDMGIRTVAVYSEADKDALHVASADEAVCIGAAPAQSSYLDGDKVIKAALDTGADAIHPGYGFLSENAAFARKVAKAGLVFIGPAPKAIEAMGGKSQAKALMEKAGVPLVPGYHGDNQDEKFLTKKAAEIGFPVLIKASAGGGGKGMRVVETAGAFKDALAGAKREALAAFGDDHVLIEKYLIRPRHVEIQVFGDSHGNIVHLFERDCSLQRRHQKVVEEAPAPGMSAELREKMGKAAIAAAKAINYTGAGTVEFLLDKSGDFYFMEMNTRLQVEHPVTEEITGIDLVEWQLRIASGEKLPKNQDEITITGHAVEVRLYAEDPRNDFLPAAGKINYLRYTEPYRGLRIETAVHESPWGDGDEVSIHYDPMIAKIITYGRTRDEALEGMSEALSDLRLTGLKTNLEFLQNIILHPDFQKAALDTGFIEARLDDLIPVLDAPDELTLCLGAIGVVQHRLFNQRADGAPSPWGDTTGWRQNGIAPIPARFSMNEDSYDIDVVFLSTGMACLINENIYHFEVSPSEEDLSLDVGFEGQGINASVIVDGADVDVIYDGLHQKLCWQNPLAIPESADTGGGRLTAPMPGKIVAIKVNVGDCVKKGAPLVILEAMKMEHTITAPADGEIKAVNAEAGDQVDEKLELVSFK